MPAEDQETHRTKEPHRIALTFGCPKWQNGNLQLDKLTSNGQNVLKVHTSNLIGANLSSPLPVHLTS